MGGMGPAPKEEGRRARRNATIATTKLPANGRTGKAPTWPLIPDIVTKARRGVWADKVDRFEGELEERLAEGLPPGTLERRLDAAREQLAIYELRLQEQRKLETALWRALWKTPQAVQWEQLGWYRDVAQYVRFKVLGELGDMDAAREARQWSDRLGLNPLAMLRLRWSVQASDGEQDDGRGRPGRAGSRFGDLRVVGGSTQPR